MFEKKIFLLEGQGFQFTKRGTIIVDRELPTRDLLDLLSSVC